MHDALGMQQGHALEELLEDVLALLFSKLPLYSVLVNVVQGLALHKIEDHVDMPHCVDYLVEVVEP